MENRKFNKEYLLSEFKSGFDNLSYLKIDDSSFNKIISTLQQVEFDSEFLDVYNQWSGEGGRIDYNKATNTVKVYSNGYLKIEYQIKDGKQHGTYKRFHPNGQLQVELHYADGQQVEGEIISFHENGQIARKVYLGPDGNFSGVFSEWHPNGIKSREGYYFLKIRKEVLVVLNEWNIDERVLKHSVQDIEAINHGELVRVYNSIGTLIELYKFTVYAGHNHFRTLMKEDENGQKKFDFLSLLDEQTLERENLPNDNLVKWQNAEELEGMILIDNANDLEIPLSNLNAYEIFVVEIVELCKGCCYQLREVSTEKSLPPLFPEIDFEELAYEHFENEGFGEFDQNKPLYEDYTLEEWSFFQINEEEKISDIKEYLINCLGEQENMPSPLADLSWPNNEEFNMLIECSELQIVTHEMTYVVDWEMYNQIDPSCEPLKVFYRKKSKDSM